MVNVDKSLINREHHDEVVRMYREQIMRLEFDKEDLHREVEFYKSRIFPTRLPDNQQQNKPVFARTSLGRARVQLENRKEDRTEKK